MTSRQARRERRAAERKEKKAEISKAKADSAANHNLSFQLPEDCLPEDASAPSGFVSQTAIASSRRAEINRANAQFSTGPRSRQGKLASSRNSTKHGLASGKLIIPGEDPAEFQALLTALWNEHQPAAETETLLVKQIAQSYWLEQRALRLQNACFTETGVDEKGLALFLRYGVTHNRAFYKALKELQRLQQERRKAERGFVSQNPLGIRPGSGFVSHNAVGEEFVRQNDPSIDLGNGFVSQTASVEALETSRARECRMVP